MNFETAKEIYEAVARCDEHLNNICEIIEKIEEVTARKKFRQAVADVIGRIYTDIEMPLELEHPSLRSNGRTDEAFGQNQSRP